MSSGSGILGSGIRDLGSGDRDPGIQGFRDPGIQGFRDSGIQIFRYSGIQGYRDPEISDSRMVGSHGSGWLGPAAAAGPVRIRNIQRLNTDCFILLSNTTCIRKVCVGL